MNQLRQKKTGKYSRKYDSIIFLKIRIWMHLRNHKLNLNFYLVLKIIFILLVMDLKFEFFVWNNSLKIALHFEQNKSNVDFYIDKGYFAVDKIWHFEIILYLYFHQHKAQEINTYVPTYVNFKFFICHISICFMRFF